MPRGRRIALQSAGALLAVAVAIGAPGWFMYNVYRSGQPSDRIQTVQPDQTATWQHVSWQVNVQQIPDPGGRPETSERRWLKVIATRTALDAEGAIRHGTPEIVLKDQSGRSWHVEVLKDETPPETTENKVGAPYRIEFIGVVPPAVADKIEVHLRPSTARSVPGQSVEDMMKASSSEEAPNQVLRFLS